MLKIRLRRMGAIRQPHYRIVVADARSPRDGRFIETLGHYNPRTEPPVIQVDVAKYEEWKRKGAQPTDAVVSLVRQFNKRQRSGQVVEPSSLQTRTASGKSVVQVAPAEPVEEAPVRMAGAEAEADVTEAPMNEAVAEATRDEGEGAEALTAGAGSAGTEVADADREEEALLDAAGPSPDEQAG